MRTPPPPRHFEWFLFAGVFFLFAPSGLLFCLIQRPPTTWSATLIIALFSGLCAVGWAIAFQRRSALLFLAVVPFNVAMPLFGFPFLFRAGLSTPGSSLGDGARQATIIVLSFLFLSIGFTLVIQHIRRRERLSAEAEAELSVARRIHGTLVPAITISNREQEVAGVSLASSAMGGDLIDAVAEAPGSDGRRALDLFLADVSGHGVGAGIVMGGVKSAIRSLVRSDRDLAAVAVDLNGVLCDLTGPETFTTFAAARIRPDGSAECVNAGHLPILIHRRDSGLVDEIESTHLPLGIDPSEPYTAVTIDLRPGDVLAMLTDGLHETRDRDGRELGWPALRARFAETAASELPLSQIAEAL